ncbi:MAG: tetratricopeptide repeat protein [Thermodesulfobacteriota bacterium]
MDPNFVPEKAVRLAEAGRHSEALAIFERNIISSLSPKDQSIYAFSLAAVEEDYERAVGMCIRAAEKEFYNPEIYLNLGRVLLLSGKKIRALKAFKKGLRFDESHMALKQEILRLGQRRTPAISFLPRGNVINKVFGLLSYKVGGQGLALMA